MQLIKFCTNNNNTIKSLKGAEIYFNNVAKFNDPFEGVFRFKLWSDKSRVEQFYLKHYSGDPRKLSFFIDNPVELEKLINKTFEYRFKNNAVTCFSKESSSTDILMWSHYANDHGGICMVFDTEEMEFSLGDQLLADARRESIIISAPTGPHEVHYQKEYINTDPVDGNLSQQTFLTTKFDVWQYEREYRFIASRVGCYHFQPQALKKVIFGLRTPSNYKSQVRNIVKKIYPFAEFYRIKLKEQDFAFELEIETFSK